jgi:hypothetical protein
MITEIQYPSSRHKKCLDLIYRYCLQKGYSLILKGSLAKGTATEFSDIDLIISGVIPPQNIDEIITLYGTPVMTNFTVNPKGILILVYQDNITIDLDIRETIIKQDLIGGRILLNNDFHIDSDSECVVRKEISSKYMPDRPEWYKMLRLVHRGMIKYLSNKIDDAEELLQEIKENLTKIDIHTVGLNNIFEHDIQCVFSKISNKYEVDSDMKVIFKSLFNEFRNK